MTRTLIILLIFVLGGCATTYTNPRPADYASTTDQSSNNVSTLFSTDSAVLSDSDIVRILDYSYSPPSLNRIALLPFGWSSWSGWSEEMAIATESVNSNVIELLNSSEKVYDASFLPSILVPDQRSVPYLREAAARYQADLLLVFRSACQSFERYRLFQADETRAFCNVEAVLLDIRTGLVPFVATSSKSFSAIQNDEDLNFRETILKSQLDSIAEALGEISLAVINFIESGDGGL